MMLYYNYFYAATMVNVVCPTMPLAAGCPALGDPDKGTVAISTEDINTGSIATYTCNEGLMLMGSATRECQSDGTWSGEEPKCELTGMCMFSLSLSLSLSLSPPPPPPPPLLLFFSSVTLIIL